VGFSLHDVRGFASLAPPACSSRGFGRHPSSCEESAGACVASATQANVGQEGSWSLRRILGSWVFPCTTFGASLRSPLRRALHDLFGERRTRGIQEFSEDPWVVGFPCTTFGASLRSPLRRALHEEWGARRSGPFGPLRRALHDLFGERRTRGILEFWKDPWVVGFPCTTFGALRAPPACSSRRMGGTTFGASLRSPLRRALHGVWRCLASPSASPTCPRRRWGRRPGLLCGRGRGGLFRLLP